MPRVGRGTPVRLGDLEIDRRTRRATVAGRDLRLSLIPSGGSGERDLLGALRVADGSFVTFRVRPFLGSPPSFAMTMAVHLLPVGVTPGEFRPGELRRAERGLYAPCRHRGWHRA